MSKYTPQIPLEELIRQQGVRPGALDAWLEGPWSDHEDEEVNAFLALRRESDALPPKSLGEEAEELARAK